MHNMLGSPVDSTQAPPESCALVNAIWVSALALGVFALHFPGQASLDTLAQLRDGLTRVYTSNQPPAMSLLLSSLRMPGVLALDVGLFALAIFRLLGFASAPLGRQRIALVVMFLFPVPLIYLGIIWKDVLFAHAALLALLLLPRNEVMHWKSLVASASVLALAVAVRQQGALVVVVTLGYLLFAQGADGLRRTRRWMAAGAWLLIFLLCSGVIKATVQTSGDTSKNVALDGPLRQLAMFDLGGIASQVPELRFPAIEKGAPAILLAHRPTREHLMSVLGRYRPDRQDYMDEPDLRTNIWIPSEDLFADWRTNILLHPQAYVVHRLDALSWTLGWHDPRKCLPYVVGIHSEPAALVTELDLQPGTSVRAKFLDRVGGSVLFLFRPVIYVALSMAVLGLLVLRGWREHGLMIAIQTGGLAYAASYLLVGFACDFRYTYYSTVTALMGLAYVFVSGTGRARADQGGGQS